MAFGRLDRSSPPPPISDINMTPLIDVMLVLLVIFIVTAPLLASSLKLDLPAAGASTPSDTPGFVAVALDADGQLYLGEQRASAEEVERALREAGARDPQTEVRLRADRAVPYGQVAGLIDVAQRAGLSRIGFVTEPAAPR
ncbi:ExbD/TolR family protein [Rubrivivax gelatinosus]|uniref:Biopolymer transport protein ExbD n=1 Tax=Rubrivivax gelatinosus (strain NBRC 100245 / IL144) TaxID=983917 RepID=I0HXW4_RUBGI|nr:biopolymer transporter ExbD [Rubrivivax gelatinosus]MBG6079783.1 biopolymer transport protein ExbD [Rubrivivax gelatinosus]BAL97851.1 biopolymer transport protein ExbD [Rubrivivax gelatinosus IL144]